MVPKRVPINHPLGLIWHPLNLEGVGRYLLSTTTCQHLIIARAEVRHGAYTTASRGTPDLHCFRAEGHEPSRWARKDDWMPTRCSHCNNTKRQQQSAGPGNLNGSQIISGWWLQPTWKILVQIGSFPQIGMKIKNIWNHHLHNEYLFAFILDKPTGLCFLPSESNANDIWEIPVELQSLGSNRQHVRCILKNSRMELPTNPGSSSG